MNEKFFRPATQRQILGFDGKPITSKPKSVFVPGLRRNAADVALTSPEIRNPLLNIVNFFLPYNYKVLNQWIRYYDRFHPMVGNCIDLHGYFPISKFDLKLKKTDEDVLGVYQDCTEEIELFQRFLEMSREFELIGEEYPYLHWSDELNFFDAMILMNPDFINVKMHPLAYGMKPTIELEPDELLKSLVQSNEPEDIEIKQALDPVVVSAVMMGQNIRIDPFNTEQIARKASPYEPRGTSIVLRCFVPGTEVFMADGTVKSVETISVGESCWTHKGRVSEVVDTIETDYSGKMVRIYADNVESPTVCTADHKFPVYVKGRKCAECGEELTHKQYKKGQLTCSRSCNAIRNSIFRNNVVATKDNSILTWKEAGDLKAGDMLIHARQKKFGKPNGVTEDMARLLGYFLAEGSYQKDRTKKKIGLSFSFCLDEKESWGFDVRSILKNTFGVESSVHKDRKNGLKIMTLRTGKIDECLSWVLSHAGEYSYGKKLSKDVLAWPLNLQRNVLIGFCRGDGSVSTYPELSCCTVSYNLANQLSKISYNLGLPHRFKKNLNKSARYRTSYWLLFPGSVNLEFIEECFPSRVNRSIPDSKSVNEIISLRLKGMTFHAIAEDLNERGFRKTGGSKWDASTVGLVVKKKVYGIKGRGKHTHMDVNEDYVLVPVKKVESYDWSGKVYCVTVKDEEHTIALKMANTNNCLKDLLYEDKLREAQYSVADGMITPKVMYKLGDPVNGYMPTTEDLTDFRALLQAQAHDPLAAIVTHYGLSIEYVGAYGKILPIVPEFQFIEDRILTGLYTNKALTHGEGPTFANATVAMEALQGRYMAKREKLEDFAIRKIYTPVALANEFYEPLTEAQMSHGVRPSSKDRKLNLPAFDWKQKLKLVDDVQRKQMVINLRNRPIPEVSLRKIYDELGIDFQTEMAALKEESKIMRQMKQDYGVENPLINPGSKPGGQAPKMPGMPGESGTTKPVQAPRDIMTVNSPGGSSKSSTPEPGGSSKTKEPGESLKGANERWNSELRQRASEERDKLLAALQDPPRFFSPDGQLKEVNALVSEAELKS